MKTLLTYKGIKYLCIAAALPTTAVVTHRSHKQINRVVERVHPKPKPARKYVAEVRKPIPATDLPIAPVAAIATAECVPGSGGFAGGGGGSGGFIGVGGGAIGGVGSVLPPVGTPVTVSPVPEPSKWALMIFGFGGIGGAMRRRNL